MTMMMAFEHYIALVTATNQLVSSLKRSCDLDGSIGTVTDRPSKKRRCCHQERRLSHQPSSGTKQVRFSPKDMVKVFESNSDDLTPTLWYQHEEYQRIRQELKETITALETIRPDGTTGSADLSSVIDSKVHCLRGLEHIVAQVLYQVMRVRSKKVVHAVLCQQQLQRQTGQLDVEAIRLSSFIMSVSDRRKAWTRAQSDTLVV